MPSLRLCILAGCLSPSLLTDEQMEASVLSFQPLTLALTPPCRIGLSTIFQGLLVIFSRPSNYLYKPIKYILKHSLKYNIRQPTFTVPTSSSTTYPPCSAVMYVYKLRMHHVGISPFVNGQFPSQPLFFPLVCICSFLLLICCVILFEGKQSFEADWLNKRAKEQKKEGIMPAVPISEMQLAGPRLGGVLFSRVTQGFLPRHGWASQRGEILLCLPVTLFQSQLGSWPWLLSDQEKVKLEYIAC